MECVILGVVHDEFKQIDVQGLGKENSVIYDVKWLFPSNQTDGRL